MNMGFREIDHTADVAVHVWGRDLKELFTAAALGLASQLAKTDGVICQVEETVSVEAYDTETLLVTWLGELLYLAEREASVFVAFDIHEITPTRLEAVVRGGVVADRRRHIKAVTFSGLEIVHTGEGYEVTIVFDV